MTVEILTDKKYKSNMYRSKIEPDVIKELEHAHFSKRIIKVSFSDNKCATVTIKNNITEEQCTFKLSLFEEGKD